MGQAAQHAGMQMIPGGAMTGLPEPLFLAALFLALLLTGWSLWHRGKPGNPGRVSRRLDLLQIRPLRWLVSRRPFQFVLQVPLVLALFLILAAGFQGTPVADRNFATVATWTIWWTLLILDIVLLGRMWCLVCPWEALASWIRRLAFWRRRREEPLALELPWPGWLRNVYPATLFFIGLTWLELGFGVTRSPRATAILGLAMILLAALPALLFERRSFCRYACLVGRICGLYSMVAPLEVRARDLEICRSCRTKDCLNGNERGYPCPTGQYLPAMSTNTYCTVCSECVKSCSQDNVAINLRPWATDLQELRKPRRDEAVLALVMLSLTSFHGLTMTPVWSELLAWFRGVSGWSYSSAFSLGMSVILVLPGLLYWGVGRSAARLVLKEKYHSGRSREFVVTRYAYPLIVVALMYHLAHNAGHFLVEAGRFLPVLSDPFGSGANYLNTAGWPVGPLAGATSIWSLQILLVGVGLWLGLRAAERAHLSVALKSPGRDVPLGARLLVAGFLLAVTILNLWLLAQPMEMRTGM